MILFRTLMFMTLFHGNSIVLFSSLLHVILEYWFIKKKRSLAWLAYKPNGVEPKFVLLGLAWLLNNFRNAETAGSVHEIMDYAIILFQI
ncbi:hypothetical protein QVD17_36073 [Tagetes erecta]|uniref:Uncharacterized protein n=1 Tax=Tagetes erecta TaxID=13708 RepID=A0AAD8NHS9_TARER|nr:hypothetical protein QVD17_36073 [Tagetes erecta]